MTFTELLSAYCSTFWHGVLLSSIFWLCVLNLGLWYWRRKIQELAAIVAGLSGLSMGENSGDGEG